MQGFFDSLIFSPQNPQCNDFFENFHKILIPCLESRVMKLMTRNLVETEANLSHGISDPELMTRHSTNDTELFRKMTSLILMGKISPPGHCPKPCYLQLGSNNPSTTICRMVVKRQFQEKQL